MFKMRTANIVLTLALVGYLASSVAAPQGLLAVANYDGEARIRVLNGYKCTEESTCITPASFSIDLRSEHQADKDRAEWLVEDIYLATDDLALLNPRFAKWIPRGMQQLGLVLNKSKQQTLTRELTPDGTAVLSGRLSVDVLLPAEIVTGLRVTDYFGWPNLPVALEGSLQVEIKLNSILGDLKEGQMTTQSSVSALLEVKGMHEQMAPIKDMIVSFTFLSAPLTLAKRADRASVRELCLQPIYIKSSASDASPTGRTGQSMANQLPAAIHLWQRLGPSEKTINLTVRESAVVVSDSLKSYQYGTSYEYGKLWHNKDCVEVYFVETFAPSCWGSGAKTMYSGTASAFALISDEVTSTTTLAHELGHVMNLRDAVLTPQDGSGNTVMCASGSCTADNPNQNSGWNIYSATNPLFKVYIGPRPTITDCNRFDCGNCSAE